MFEGCDRVGKSTQCRRLVDALKTSGIEAEMMSFPSKPTFCSLDNVQSISVLCRPQYGHWETDQRIPQ